MKIVTIIQARMGSTRIPGKVLKDISGRPMLWHVVHRAGESKFVKETIVAIPSGREDDILEKFCTDNKISLFRGSEDDLLDRYYRAALKAEADVVVRITSDCPLIDPIVMDDVISAYLNGAKSYDGASNVVDRTYPRGLDTEVVSFKALEKAWKLAEKADEREHVMKCLYDHPDIYKLVSVKNKKDLSELRWTVDEEADLKLVREVYKRLYNPVGKIFLMDDVLRLLEEDKSLVKINKDVKQKAVN